MTITLPVNVSDSARVIHSNCACGHKTHPGPNLTRMCSELSLMWSRVLPDLSLPVSQHQSFDVPRAVHYVKAQKHIQEPADSPFTAQLRRCLEMISDLGTLFERVTELQDTPYDSSQESNEAQLVELWELMMPEQQLSARVSNDWKTLGFQGRDPATDFRGMGMLGLKQLLFFAQQHNTQARGALTVSCHPERGFSYAIVGINLSSMAVEFLDNPKLHELLYHLSNQPECSKDSLVNFNDFYCFLFCEFSRLWRQVNPENMLAFNQIRDSLKATVTRTLEHNLEAVSAAIVAMRVLNHDANSSIQH
ncbi:ELMO domain-containing protein, variant [Capsaspora owczarzaki ATCC 30864]|uniref:ELMO domain-containing protein, variant n=1 Tax=Capsaspora owczarzaki (strain ATCC 30864) TaxID=595528 RepID=UPI0003520C46|nr:ELMO domain-containing protein, variant [Capsaspora owczarzaki ATCC 30864]|eukprot:XP_011269939.1 ELMO domain-containing protein, variant [Capsaspora owczarzaki ATCC 30864]